MNNILDIVDDIHRLDFRDPEIHCAFERLRRKYKDKGLPYRELLGSKLYGTVKYMIVESNDAHNTIMITDLDTNETYETGDNADEKLGNARV